MPPIAVGGVIGVATFVYIPYDAEDVISTCGCKAQKMKKSKKDSQKAFIAAVRDKINSRRKGKPITYTDMSLAGGYNPAVVGKMAIGHHTIPAWLVAIWRKRWKLHISREEMAELMEKHLIADDREETV